MSEPLEHMRSERRRLQEVRQIFFDALLCDASDESNSVAFYEAVSDYIEAAMDRINTQGMRLSDMLRSRVCRTEADAQQAILDLDERMAANQAHLKRFLEARDLLKQDDPEGLRRFIAVSHSYADFLSTSLKGHDESTALARHHFTEEDWDYMADIHKDDIARERTLYNHVFATTPEHLAEKRAS